MLRFLISNKSGRQHFEHLAGPIEFGRGPERDGITRCVIQDGYVSKDHVKVDEMPNGQVKIENLSLRNSIRLPDNSVIGTGESRTLRAPVRLTVGETLIDIEVVVDPIAAGPLDTVASPVRPPRGAVNPDAAKAAAALDERPEKKEQLPSAVANINELGASPDPQKLMTWFETFVAVQQAAAGSPEFYKQTAEAVVKLVGLDRGLV